METGKQMRGERWRKKEVNKEKVDARRARPREEKLHAYK